MQAIAVIGGGTMGRDIAAIVVAHGGTAHVVEPDTARRVAVHERVRAAVGQLGAAFEPAHLAVHGALAEVAWSEVGAAIECVPEQLAVKRTVFAELERVATPGAILGSNSSSFPISDIAAGLATRARMVGLHFFMPAHLVPAVEVIRGADTDASVWQRAAELMRELGKVPVMVRKDIPGFLANRIQHALMREAFALIEAGYAAPEDVDKAVRFGFGFRYVAAGPILQKDLAGLDIHCAAARTMYPHLANDAAPCAALERRVAEGKLGVKTGAGFYRWDAESARAEQARYERDLMDALRILERSLGRG